MYNFVDIIWWHNSLSFFCYYNFCSEKGFRFWPKKSFRALVGTTGLHSNPGICFMSQAVKGMIRIANEESNCLSSFVILTMPLITMLIKELPELECSPIVPTKAGVFWGAKIWNLFLNRNCNNRRMKESYATKLCPQNFTHLCFIPSKFEYHQCIW